MPLTAGVTVTGDADARVRPWRFVGVIAMTIKGHLPRRAVAGSVDTGRVPTADPVVNVVTGVR